MRQRFRSHWLAAEDLEMAGLIKRKVWDRVLRSTLLPSDTIFQTPLHSKIKRKGGKFEKYKVRLVVRGARMTKKDESGIEAFTQGELLDGDGRNAKVYISAPPGFPEDPDYCYLLKRPLYGMPCAARASFTTARIPQD
jgi:hypothetical protein